MEKEKFKDIETFFPLVEKIARKYKKSHIELDDLRQQGMVGLLEALRAYDPEREKTLFAFVSKYIEGSIRHYIRDKSTLIRYPRWFRALAKRIENFIVDFKEKSGRPPSISEIGESLNIQEDGIREYFRIKTLLYFQYFEDSENKQNIDYKSLRTKIRHKTYESFKLPIEDILTLYDAIDTLSELKKKVVYYIFFQGYTHKETAEEIGISERHVSRMKKEALNELKDKLKDN